MSLAVLVESNAGEMDGLPAKHQTLVFPFHSLIKIYHRTSNGSKGRGQAWVEQTGTSLLPETAVSTIPVAVALNERDTTMASLGVITNIAVKALYAQESAEYIEDGAPHRLIVEGVIQSFREGETAVLNSYLTDKRRTQPVEVAPVFATAHNPSVAQVAPSPTVAQVAPIAQPEPVVSMANLITVPDSKWAKEYINRRFGGKTEWDIFDQALKDGDNILIEGEAGSGKTMAVQSYASARNLPYFNVSNNNGIDPSQLFGRWIPRSDGHGYRWQDGAVTHLVRYGGVLLLNEVNFLPARVSTVLFSLLDYRREIQLLENGGEVIKAHPNLLIVGDMNMGYRGTQELNQAFNDRFSIKLEFPYDRTIELKIVRNQPLLSLADKLRAQYESEELTTPISTRSLVAFVKNAKRFGVDFAISSFVNGFNKDERGGVRMACETLKANIANAIGVVADEPEDTTTERV